MVNADHPMVIEIWNLVFIQHNRDADGVLEDLPAKHVDTGLGLERVTTISQGVYANYETDLFMPIFSKIEELSQTAFGEKEKVDVAMKVVADHSRAAASQHN